MGPKPKRVMPKVWGVPWVAKPVTDEMAAQVGCKLIGRDKENTSKGAVWILVCRCGKEIKRSGAHIRKSISINHHCRCKNCFKHYRQQRPFQYKSEPKLNGK